MNESKTNHSQTEQQQEPLFTEQTAAGGKEESLLAEAVKRRLAFNSRKFADDELAASLCVIET